MDAEDCTKQTANVCDAAVDVLLVAGDICKLYEKQWLYITDIEFILDDSTIFILRHCVFGSEQQGAHLPGPKGIMTQLEHIQH